MKRFVYIFLIYFSLPAAGITQVLTNAEKAFSVAGKSQRAILLIFSGSDWCQPCIRLHKFILADSAFQQFASRELVILEADFPQRKKMDKELVSQNEALARQFNPSGAFPRLLLLKPDKTVITVLEYNNQTSPTFVQQVSRYLQNANMLKEYSRRAKLMGSAFEFIVVAENDDAGEKALTTGINEVQRIEALLTEFNNDSETSLINRNAGTVPVMVSDETFHLVKRSLDISKLTGGAFDITAGALKKLYNFKGDSCQSCVSFCKRHAYWFCCYR
jgi:thioredoxin-related protein